MARQSRRDATITRRQFVKGALAASAVYGLGCGSGGSSSSSSSTYDVAIVGAGAAGLAAARRVIEARRKVIVLDARDRVGGRAFSDNASFTVPVDLGAQWLHEGASNPLAAMAVQAGHTTVPYAFPRVFFDGDRQLATDDPDVESIDALVLAIYEAIGAAGASVASGAAADHAAAGVVAHLRALPYFAMASGIVSDAFGPSLDRLSVWDFSNFTDASLLPVGAGVPEEFLLPSGLGNFIASLAGGVPVALSTPVSAIEWGGRSGVRLTTPTGAIRAKTAIVTAPVAVLDSGAIEFRPALDRAYTDAFSGLQMQSFAKVFLEFAPSVDVRVGSASSLCAPLSDTSEVQFVHSDLWDRNIAMLLIGGTLAPPLERDGEAALVDYTLGTVASMFGSSLNRDTLVASSVHSWLNDPWSRGCVSYAPPGAVPHRQTLATPVADRLFFAGEAASLYGHGSVHGAYETGLAAAQEVLARL
jgi:monoamine oxidase